MLIDRDCTGGRFEKVWNVLLGLLLAVELGGSFGAASATAQPTSAGQMEVEITVEAPAGRSVVVHVVVPGGEQQTVAMRERAPGVYGTVVEVPAVDAVAVYEIVGSGDLSTPARLTDLGVDPAVVGAPSSGSPPTTSEGLSRETRQWGWLALALGSSSLALVAVWFFVGWRRDEVPTETDEPVA